MVTLAKLKQYCGLSETTYDDVLISFIAQLTKEIENYIGYGIVEKTYTNENFITDGEETEFELSSIPITNTTPLTVTWNGTQLVENENYETEPITGIVCFYKPLPIAINKLKITYSAGYPYTPSTNDTDGSSEVPTDLQGVVLEACKKLLESHEAVKAGSANIVSKSIDDFSVTFYKNSSEVNEFMNGYLLSKAHVLNNYKRILI